MMPITLKGISLCTDKPTSVDQVTEETEYMNRQMAEMHLELHETMINLATKEQHNIFTQKYIYREAVRPCDNHGVTSTSMQRQALGNGYHSPEAMSTFPTRGAPSQRDSIGSATGEMQKEMLDEDGKEETLMMDDDQNLTKTFEQMGDVTVGRHVH